MATAPSPTLGQSAPPVAAGVRGTAASFSGLSRPDAFDPAIRVLELGHMDRVMWDANILYSQGRLEEVRAAAKALQEKGQDVGYELEIALLRLDGNKVSFEDLAVEYAVQTGRSPPVWLDAHDMQEKVDAAPKRVLVKIQSLTGESIIETTIKMESPWPLTMDFSEVSKLDEMGLDIFQESLSGRISRRESTILINTEKLVTDVSKKIRQVSFGHQGLWTFCLNVHRLNGNRKAFDELSGDFAEKSGQDMPVWQDLRDQELVNSRQQSDAPERAREFELGDSLAKMGPQLLRMISASDEFKSAKQSGRSFYLDFVGVKRWTINDMSDVVSMLRDADKEHIKLEFINVNEMLRSLFKGFGIDKSVKVVVAGETT